MQALRGKGEQQGKSLQLCERQSIMINDKQLLQKLIETSLIENSRLTKSRINVP